MIIYIPRSAYQAVPSSVYESIRCQTLSTRVIEVVGSVNEPSCKHRAEARNLCLEMARRDFKAFFVMMDHDTVLLRNNILEKMYNKMIEDSSIGSVCLSGKIIPSNQYDHFDLACTMIKTEAIKGISFKEKFPCECNIFSEDIKKAGYKQCYLSTEILIGSVGD